MPQPSWRLTLRIIAVLLCLASFVWLVFKPGFDSLVTFLVSIAAFLGSFVPDSTQTDSLERRNRRAMLEKVSNFWVKGVLEQSLHGAALIELGMEYKPEAVQYPWATVLQRPDQPAQPLPPGTKTAEVFDQTSGELLILGAPGSGKTTMLLDLARDLIARAEQDETLPIPIVFNLSSWAEKRPPLDEWLVDELRFRYDVPKKIAEAWVKDDYVLPLLDGLDEVKLEHRVACVEAINRFRQERGLLPTVVCSRIADYEALNAQLRLRGAIVLQPLTHAQVDGYLASAGGQLASVRAMLQRDAALEELAESPLTLSIMALAYHGLPITELAALDTAEKRRKHLFAAYVQRMFKRRGSDKRYTQKQVIHWLSWLAGRMVEHAQTTFYLERMQPTWLQDQLWRQLYKVVLVLVGGLIGLGIGLIGMVFGLVHGPVGAVFGPIGGPVVGLVMGLAFGLAVGLSEIRTVETLRWSWSRAKFGLVGGLGAGLFGLAFGLLGGLGFGLGLGLVLGLVGGLYFVLTGDEKIETKTTPNQGIWQSARNAILGWLVYGSLFGLFLGLFGIGGLAYGLVGGLLGCGLLVGLAYGLAACIQHAVLRFLLYIRGTIPLNYVRFLDYCAERIFLRKVGGGYIFVHRLLMEYFAGLEGELNH